MWKLNSYLLLDNLFREEINKLITNFLELKENGDIPFPNQWDKAVLRVKFIALSVLVKKLERSCTNILAAHLRALEQKEANSPNRSRRQEIVKLRAEIKQVETKQDKESTKPEVDSFRE